MMILWSCFTTVLLIAFPAPLVQIFIQGDEQVLQIGGATCASWAFRRS